MQKILQITDFKIKIFLVLFCLFASFIFEPNYSADSLRYVFAGMQLLENFFTNISEPNFSFKFNDSVAFHSNIEYEFPRREFFTIIPNLLFYYFSILSEDSLNYIIILNLIIYSLMFYYCSKFYNFNNNFKIFVLFGFLFFGHYQIAGWNIKVLPEIMYFCTLLFLLIKLINIKKINLQDAIILILLSILCFLIRPQGIIFAIVIFIYLSTKKIFEKKIYFFIILLFFFNLFLFPLLIYFEVNEIYNIPIISKANTGLLDGAIISGWINYFDGKLVFQEVRFSDKQFSFKQSYSYLDLLKISFYRLYYYISPYKYYQSIYINIWNIFYFLLIYIISINYLIRTNDNLKKNLFIFLIVSVLSFHLIFPVTGTFRYQLSLIAIIFVLNFEYLKMKFNKND